MREANRKHTPIEEHAPEKTLAALAVAKWRRVNVSHPRFDNALANIYRWLRPYLGNDVLKSIYDGMMLLILVGLIGLALSVSGIGCPIEGFTGWCCPICGMTRAWIAFLSLDLVDAFAYHPLFWCVPLGCLLVGFLVHADTKSKRYAIAFAITSIAFAFLALWLLRMIVPGDLALVPFADVSGDIVHIGLPRY